MAAVSLGGNQEVAPVAASAQQVGSGSGNSSFVPVPGIGLTASGGAKSAVGDDSGGGLVETLSSIRGGEPEVRFWDLTPQWDGSSISKNPLGAKAVDLLDPGGQQGGIGFAELLDPDGHILALPFSSQLKWRSYCRMRLVMEKMEVVALMWVGGGEAPLAAKIEHVIVNGSNVCGLDGGVAVVMDVIVKGANKKMRVAVDMPVASLESNGVGVKFPDPLMG